MRKGVILVVVIGVMLVILALALAALHLMAQESRITEHNIKRTRAFYAAQAGMVLALEKLRKGVWSGTPAGKNHCLNDDHTVHNCPPPRTITDWPAIPYDVTMTIFSSGRIDIKVEY